jgi:hypothetical protein
MIDSIKIADAISKIFSPVCIAFYAIIIFLFFPPLNSYNNSYYSTLIGIFFLCIFPALPILYYFKKGEVDLWVSDRKTRTPFYIVAIIGYILSALIFFYQSNNIMFVFSISYLAVSIFLIIINMITKISTHMAGVAGPLTAITFIYGPIILPLFVIIPITMWARIKMNAHNYYQLIGGTILSIIVTYFIYLFFYNYI